MRDAVGGVGGIGGGGEAGDGWGQQRAVAPGVARLPEGEGYDGQARRDKLGLALFKLAQALAAEDSAEVADEAQHHGLRVPEGTEGNGPTALVERGE